MLGDSGRQLRMYSLLLVLLLLLSWQCWPQSYDGPQLPDGWLPVHETELTMLEGLLERQEMLLAEQESELMKAKTQLSEARKSLANSSVELSRLARSLNELGDVLRRRTAVMRVAIVTAGVSTVGAVLLLIFR